ncbi:MAG: hypothetical protein JW915_17805, partial [Chitinispirillaceae bacterium]|nr:hypothetical protein [Chitinispirillaceae bacterium]
PNDWKNPQQDSFKVSNCYIYRPSIHSRDPVGINIIFMAGQRYTNLKYANAIDTTAELYLGYYNFLNPLFQNSAGPRGFKVNPNHTISNGIKIGSAGVNKSHPYLPGVYIPKYIGATDPSDPGNSQWVDIVLNLANLGGNIAPIVSDVKITGSKIHYAETIDTIRWNAEDDNKVVKCIVEYSINGGADWRYITTKTSDWRYPWPIPNSPSNNCFIKVTAFDEAQKTGSNISSTFRIKIKKSHLRISLRQIGDSTVIISWVPSIYDGTDVTAVGLIYGIAGCADSINQPNYDTLMYNLETSSDTIFGLKKGQKYFFNTFVLDSLGDYTMWGDSGCVPVELVDRSPPDNIFTLRVAQIDSVSAKLNWYKYSNGAADIDSIGIWYRTDLYPQGADDPKAKLLKMYPATNGIDTLKELQKNHYYYFSIFARDSFGNWSSASDSSRCKLFTTMSNSELPGSFSLSSADDTVWLFGDTVKMWLSGDFAGQLKDTIDPWDAATVNPEGFVSAGKGFQFRTGGQIIKGALNISVLASNRSDGLRGERLYFFDNINNRWLVDTLSALSVKGDGIRVSSVIKDLENPVALLIDTMPPKLTVKSRTRILSHGESFTEELLLKDNVYNCMVTMVSASGGESFTSAANRSVQIPQSDSTVRHFTVTVPGSDVNQCEGVKAAVTVFDGVWKDTVLISRPVLRKANNACETSVITPMVWTPVLATATPLENTLSSALVRSSTASSNWMYDKKEIRIFKHQDADPVNPGTGTWIEFDQSTIGFFNIKQGDVSWIKARTPLVLDFGTATVPSLTDTVTFTINSHEWLDCAVPFNFDYPLTALMEAGNSGKPNFSDSIEVYSWVLKDSVYHTEPIYLSKVEALRDQNRTLKANTPYSFYNAQNKTVTVRFPGIFSEKAPALLKKGTSGKTGGWSIRLDVTGNGKQYSPVYCGYLPDEKNTIWYPLSPSFAEVPVTLVDTCNGKKFGHCIYTGERKTGMIYPFISENSNEPIQLSISSRCNLSDTVITGFYNPVSYKLSQNMVINKGQKEAVYFVVGDPGYIRTLPHHFSNAPVAISSVSILHGGKMCVVHYNLPARDYEYIRFDLFDLKGRLVLQSRNSNGVLPGSNRHILFNKNSTRMPAQGTYIISMSVKFIESKKVQRTVRKATFTR